MGHNDDMARRFFEDGERVTASITIQKPALEVYAAWFELVGLPQFVRGFEQVVAGNDRVIDLQPEGDASGSSPDRWQAEILNEDPGSLIAWKSTGMPAVPNAGSVALRELPFGRGTELKVIIEYLAPKEGILKRLGSAAGQDPKAFLQVTLFRFRQLLEAGEVATTRGQPSGRTGGRDEEGSADEQQFAQSGSLS